MQVTTVKRMWMDVLQIHACMANASMRSTDTDAFVSCHTPDQTVPLSWILARQIDASTMLCVFQMPRTERSPASAHLDTLVTADDEIVTCFFGGGVVPPGGGISPVGIGNTDW